MSIITAWCAYTCVLTCEYLCGVGVVGDVSFCKCVGVRACNHVCASWWDEINIYERVHTACARGLEGVGDCGKNEPLHLTCAPAKRNVKSDTPQRKRLPRLAESTNTLRKTIINNYDVEHTCLIWCNAVAPVSKILPTTQNTHNLKLVPAPTLNKTCVYMWSYVWASNIIRTIICILIVENKLWFMFNIILHIWSVQNKKHRIFFFPEENVKEQ